MQEKFQAVRACVTGQIYDSSPADFVSEIGVKFLSSPVVWKSQKPSIVISLGTKTAASILDPLFSSQFEQQRVEYWLALEQSVVIKYFHFGCPLQAYLNCCQWKVDICVFGGFFVLCEVLFCFVSPFFCSSKGSMFDPVLA